MLRHLPTLLAAVALGSVALLAFQQQREIAALRAEVAAVRDEASHAAPAGGSAVFTARPSPPPRPATAPPPSAAPSETRPAPAPRAPVTSDEVARVESAMLNLLESDRPELHQKLRDLVQEQQEAIAQERQEVRRERWAARAELRLTELSGAAAMTADQRRAVIDILLGTRDQIEDIRRNASSPQEIAAAREARRRLRGEADARVRELLSPAQYEGYRQAFDRDDDDDDNDRRRGPPQR